MYKSVRHLTRDAWKSGRTFTLGASQSIALFPEWCPPYISRDKLIREKVYGENTFEQHPSRAAEWGSALEDDIIDMVNQGFHDAGEPLPPVLPHPQTETWVSEDYPWLSCTPDAYMGAGWLAEVKAVSGFQRKEWKWAGVPIKYQVQCQHQMIVSGAERVTLLVGFGARGDVGVFHLYPQPRLQQDIIDTSRAFWEEVERLRSNING